MFYSVVVIDKQNVTCFLKKSIFFRMLNLGMMMMMKRRRKRKKRERKKRGKKRWITTKFSENDRENDKNSWFWSFSTSLRI